MRSCARTAIASAVLMAVGAGVAPAVDQAAETPTIRPVMFDPDNPDRSRTGALIWRGGLEIIHPDSRFGGLSGLHISPDGHRMTTITDRGSWMTAQLSYSQGSLVGMSDIRIGDLKGRRSDRLPGSWHDAESLATDGSGGFLVGFERRHRIWRYPAGKGQHALTRRPVPLEAPRQLAKQPVEWRR